MPINEALVRRAQQRLSGSKADEYGFLGVLDGGSYAGVAASDGYIYDIPYHSGYVYARVIAGSSFEVCEVIQGGVGRSPERLVGFRREGAALVGMKVNAQANAVTGGDGSDLVPTHDQAATTVTYTPTSPLTATTVQGALDEVAALLAPAAIDDDVDARLLELLQEGAKLTRMTGMGVTGGRPKPPVVRALLRWPYGSRR